MNEDIDNAIGHLQAASLSLRKAATTLIANPVLDEAQRTLQLAKGVDENAAQVQALQKRLAGPQKP